MTRYDDETVITLLKAAAPEPPDLPGRVDAVRRRAGHQRHLVATQTLGCVALAVSLVAGTVALSRVGGAGASHNPQVAMAAMASAMEKVHTYRMDATFDSGHGRMTMKADVDARLPGAHIEQVYSDSTESHRIELVLLGDDVYMTSEDYGDKWVLMETEPSDDDSRDMTADKFVEEILEDATQVRYDGPERIRGVATSRYRLQLPLESASTPAVVDAAIWVDSKGLLRRIQYANGTLLTSELSAATVDLYDYGAKVSIKAPRADQVVSDAEAGRIASDILETESDSAWSSSPEELCEEAPSASARAGCLEQLKRQRPGTRVTPEPAPSK